MKDLNLGEVISQNCVIIVEDKMGNLLYSNREDFSLFLKKKQEFFYIGANCYQQSIFYKNEKTIYLYTDVTRYTKDFLTGVLNRFGFDICLDNLPEGYYDLALCDVDYFKKVNDTYGHSAGDLLLKELISFIQACIGEEGLFARYGGEEFIILIKKTSSEEIRQKLETMRKKVEEFPFIYKNHILHITLTIGVSCYKKNKDNILEKIEQADKAMYYGKKKGRNTIVFWPIEKL